MLPCQHCALPSQSRARSQTAHINRHVQCCRKILSCVWCKSCWRATSQAHLQICSMRTLSHGGKGMHSFLVGAPTTADAIPPNASRQLPEAFRCCYVVARHALHWSSALDMWTPSRSGAFCRWSCNCQAMLLCRGKQIALDVARGLHYLHSKRILHLDLKYASQGDLAGLHSC